MANLCLSGINSGTDEFGEHQHCSQYKHLWTNSPKECHEFPYYTFEEHFGKPIPSYLPGPVMRDYLEGRLYKTQYVNLFQNY